MEPAFQAHPIPQNVTNFEFHLVGDMTLKQFGYLAAGLGMAYLMFVLLAAPAPLIAWPLILIFGSLGVAFAFLPIQERPLDHWVGAFYKAIFKPTQLEYKSAVLGASDPLFRNRLNLFLKTLKQPEEEVLNVKLPMNLVEQVKSQQNNQTTLQVSSQPQTATPPVPQPLQAPIQRPQPIQSSAPLPQPIQPQQSSIPNSQELQKTVELAKQAQTVKTRIINLEQNLARIKQAAAIPGANSQAYTAEFQKSLAELNSLNQQASSIAHELAVLTKTPQKQIITPAIVKNSPQVLEKPKTLPAITLTTFPNVINGVVVDTLGNYIEGAIIVAHDKQGLPVRALKSNKLGQFIAATPLPNGTYSLNIEKDSLGFDAFEVVLKGEILKPVVVYAKKVIG